MYDNVQEALLDADRCNGASYAARTQQSGLVPSVREYDAFRIDDKRLRLQSPMHF